MTTAYTHRMLLVISAADLERANQVAGELGGSPADFNTFSVGLNTTGDPTDPVTHYWVSPVFTSGVYQTVVSYWVPQFPTATAVDWDMDSDPGLPDRILTELGLQRIRSEGV